MSFSTVLVVTTDSFIVKLCVIETTSTFSVFWVIGVTERTHRAALFVKVVSSGKIMAVGGDESAHTIFYDISGVDTGSTGSRFVVEGIAEGAYLHTGTARPIVAILTVLGVTAGG